jgi:carnitine O-acetyltransferase
VAAELQNRLHERAELVGDNWLSEWWKDATFMGRRDPLVVFVNYFIVHVWDHTRKDGPQRAAELVTAMLPFRNMVEKCGCYFLQSYTSNLTCYSGTLEPDKIRGTPLCMDLYKWLQVFSLLCIYSIKPLSVSMPRVIQLFLQTLPTNSH